MKMQNGADIELFFSLSEKQREYIQAKLKYPKKTQGELAKLIGIHEVTISKWKKKEAFRKGEIAYNAQFLEKHVPRAVNTLVNLLDAKSEMVRLYASQDILDRTGYIFIEKEQIEHTGAVEFKDDIE